MKRLIPALALFGLATLPQTAHAGWGFTEHMGVEYSTRLYYTSPFEALPSLDFKTKGWTIQTEPLELIAGISREELKLGLNVYKTSFTKKITDNDSGWMGAFQPGASIDLDTGHGFDFDTLQMQLLAQARMGAQAQKGMGIGIYVVPGIGFAKTFDATGDDAIELAVGGQLQISAWVN